MIAAATRIALRFEQRNQAPLLIWLKLREEGLYGKACTHQEEARRNRHHKVALKEKRADAHQGTYDCEPDHRIKQYAIQRGNCNKRRYSREVQHKQIATDPQVDTEKHCEKHRCRSSIGLHHNERNR